MIRLFIFLSIFTLRTYACDDAYLGKIIKKAEFEASGIKVRELEDDDVVISPVLNGQYLNELAYYLKDKGHKLIYAPGVMVNQPSVGAMVVGRMLYLPLESRALLKGYKNALEQIPFAAGALIHEIAHVQTIYKGSLSQFPLYQGRVHQHNFNINGYQNEFSFDELNTTPIGLSIWISSLIKSSSKSTLELLRNHIEIYSDLVKSSTSIIGQVNTTIISDNIGNHTVLHEGVFYLKYDNFILSLDQDHLNSSDFLSDLTIWAKKFSDSLPEINKNTQEIVQIFNLIDHNSLENSYDQLLKIKKILAQNRALLK